MNLAEAENSSRVDLWQIILTTLPYRRYGGWKSRYFRRQHEGKHSNTDICHTSDIHVTTTRNKDGNSDDET